ncbi:glycosyltransferase [Xylanimonas ulmi]|uniref:glycosyltransferase n=1 Tax=Xylanimonas ulmi TaxID=228973 RepID=UPI001F5E3C7D|nr:glycosyltransferase [Xylanibacterium ulmi]
MLEHVGFLRKRLRRETFPVEQRLTFDPWPIPQREPSRAVRVGVILDDFSQMAFGPEWRQVALKRDSWRERLTEGLDLLFVESAWRGNGGDWRGHLQGVEAPSAELRELVEAFRADGVPTVFWNKEDPPHFNGYLATAALFDRVYTTDVECVRRYVEQLGHDRVGVLPFAAQAAIHNPVRTHGGGPTRDVAFAGTYYAHKYPERREQMDALLGGAIDVEGAMKHGLEIFSRVQGLGRNYVFPEPYVWRVMGSLDYPRMLTAYREYKAFLSVNSVVDSPSMCARRIFEIAACGTPVVTTPSAAVGEFFPADEVFVATDRAHAGHLLRAIVRSSELRDRAVHRAQRRIWREHTYASRAQRVLYDVGLSDTAERPRASVTALVSVGHPERLQRVLSTLGGQRDVVLQAILLTRGFEVAEHDLRMQAKDLGVADLVVLSAEHDTPRATCRRRLIQAADGDAVATIDDSDLYGPHYLRDQLDALVYSAADVVGKQAHYAHIEAWDATILRFADKEHQFTDFVLWQTIVARREVARTVPSSALRHREGTGFLQKVVKADGAIYSADRFGFIQVQRGAARAEGVSDAELLAGGEVQWYGRGDAHVFV